MVPNQLRRMVETYQPALCELAAGLDNVPDDSPQFAWIEAYWHMVDADFSSAGFVGRSSDGTQLYLEVHCDDDTPEREVRAEMTVLSPCQKPSVNSKWSKETQALNLWLADELQWGEATG